MKGLRIVLPVKPLAEGKSRLASRLTPRERLRLNRDLFEATLGTLIRFAGGPAVAVVSRDAGVLAAATGVGAAALAERGVGGLNAALTGALRGLRGAGAVLVVPVDLPLLTGADLACLVAAGRCDERPAVVLAADRSGSGTNALLAAPPGAIPFRFGPDSLRAHAREALGRGIEPHVVRRAGLAFDLDTPADHDDLRRPPGTAAIRGVPVAAQEC